MNLIRRCLFLCLKLRISFVRSLRELRSTRCLAVTALLIGDQRHAGSARPVDQAAAQPAYRLRLPVQCVDRHAVRPGRRHDGRRVHRRARLLCGQPVHGRVFPGLYADSRCRRSVWGLWLYPRKITVWRAIGAKTCINLFCNICLNTLWLTVTGRQGDERAARYARAEKPYSAADRDRAGLLRHEAGQPYLWRAAEWKGRCGKLLSKSGEKPVST